MGTPLSKIREELGQHLCSPEKLKMPEGLPTGRADLDQYLFSHGFPKGALSLISGKPGLGGTSLWIAAAAHALHAKKRAVWIGAETSLCPLPLRQRGLDLSRLLLVEPAQGQTSDESPEQNQLADRTFLWLLQELMASGLFDLIGCDLGERRRLREHQLRKLQNQARRAQLALVFLGTAQRSSATFSLILKMKKNAIQIERASHRAVPHSVTRRISYGSFTQHTRTRSAALPTISSTALSAGAQCASGSNLILESTNSGSLDGPVLTPRAQFPSRAE